MSTLILCEHKITIIKRIAEKRIKQAERENRKWTERATRESESVENSLGKSR